MAERHPVADLLNDEQRARVAATRFRWWHGGGITAANAACLCPLAVALDLPSSMAKHIYRALGDGPDVRSFMNWADSADSNPADVYVLLGVTPNAGGRP
jgi:hypothetical protein